MRELKTNGADGIHLFIFILLLRFDCGFWSSSSYFNHGKLKYTQHYVRNWFESKECCQLQNLFNPIVTSFPYYMCLYLQPFGWYTLFAISTLSWSSFLRKWKEKCENIYEPHSHVFRPCYVFVVSGVKIYLFLICTGFSFMENEKWIHFERMKVSVEKIQISPCIHLVHSSW